MPVRLNATLVNDKRFPRVLANLNQKIKDWRSFWIERFVPFYQNEIQQNFETEGELVYGWPDLSPEYAAWKARHFPGRKIMERTRRLRESMAPGAAGRDTVVRVRPLEAMVGTKVPYARYANRQRPILPPVPKDRLRELHQRWVTEKAREAQDEA